MIYSFNGYIPVVHESSFVHPLAAVTGNVIIGKNCYIGPGAAIRGDWGQIILEDGVNVQENCTVHMFPGKSITLKESAHVGHGAIIHGANLGKNCLIGMNSVIMDDAVTDTAAFITQSIAELSVDRCCAISLSKSPGFGGSKPFPAAAGTTTSSVGQIHLAGICGCKG